uniref:Cysteine-rich protein n=1 Tax=Hyaloperonospora arabidopsidis TaxID=272952 RepID=F6MEX5_HYAAB|nr:cysteine-rich protein [Hyaloperonospora arabidopsidis]
MHVPSSLVLFMAAVASGSATEYAGGVSGSPSISPNTLCSAVNVPCDRFDQDASSFCSWQKDPNVEFKDCCLGRCSDARIPRGYKCSDSGVPCDQLNVDASQSCGVYETRVGQFRDCCIRECRRQDQH